MQNWKTTLGGILLALGQLAPELLPSNYRWIPPLLSAVGGVVLGLGAKDFNTHSTEHEVKVATIEKVATAEKAIEAIKEEIKPEEKK